MDHMRNTTTLVESPRKSGMGSRVVHLYVEKARPMLPKDRKSQTDVSPVYPSAKFRQQWLAEHSNASGALVE